MRYCENCGKPLSDDDIFCTECGYRVEECDEMNTPSLGNASGQENSDFIPDSSSEETTENGFTVNIPISEDTPSPEPSSFEDEYSDDKLPAPQRKKTPVFLIGVLLVVLIAAGFLVWKFVFSPDDGSNENTSVAAPNTSTSAEPDSSSLSGDVSSSSEPPDSNSVIPGISSVPESSSNSSSLFDDNDTLLQAAEKAIADGDYPTAIHLLEYVLEDHPENTTVAGALDQAKELYQNEVLAEANSCIDQGDTDSAISILSGAKSVLGENAEINLLLTALLSSSKGETVYATPAPTPYTQSWNKDEYENQTESETPVFSSYTIKLIADYVPIYSGPGYHYDLTGEITDNGVYTIVEEKEISGEGKWGRLKSGVGWINIQEALAETSSESYEETPNVYCPNCNYGFFTADAEISGLECPECHYQFNDPVDTHSQEFYDICGYYEAYEMLINGEHVDTVDYDGQLTLFPDGTAFLSVSDTQVFFNWDVGEMWYTSTPSEKVQFEVSGEYLTLYVPDDVSWIFKKVN